jgi:glyoxylase-like metal-dependent hydrolase (beta-lactamase superfamily II)
VEITGTAQFEAWQRKARPPVEEVRHGLWSIPVPIPNSPLRYTLCYAFTGPGPLIIVDPGWDDADARAALESGLAVAGATVGDVDGIVLTHVHPDHHGLSGWVRDRSGAWIGMHPAEAETLPARVAHYRNADADRDWLRRAGVPAGDVGRLAITEDQLAALRRMATPDRLLDHGATLPLPGRPVRAVWTPGHTPGHLCLHDAQAGVLLTGDHLLPRITPNIAAKDETDGDPLARYLTSLAETAAFQADEALPAHEYRFRDIDVRAKAVATHHDERSADVIAAVANLTAPTAWQIAAALTWSRGWDTLDGFSRRMALGETIAHLNHLHLEGALLRSPGDAPTHWHPAVP